MKLEMTVVLTAVKSPKKWWVERKRNRARKKRLGAIRVIEREIGIGDDSPISNSTQDLLRRAPYAARIAAVLSELSVEQGRVFAIRGGWGAGKSSLKNLIAHELDAREKGAHWLDFNPWQWGSSDAIARGLFEAITDKLAGDEVGVGKKRAAKLRRYASLLAKVGPPIHSKSGDLKTVKEVLNNIYVAFVAAWVGIYLPSPRTVAEVLMVAWGITTIGSMILNYFGRDRSKDSLDEVREDLTNTLRELDRPIVVFVDDIDRLEPEQIRTVLRQVKANANLPNFIFVLMYQPTIVEAAIDPVTSDRGRAFLEKIIQANFDLPAVPLAVVYRIFDSELSKCVSLYANEANGYSIVRAGNALHGVIHPFVRNLRDARRLISSIAAHIPLHVDGDIFEVNLVDFLILETLRVFEPNLHAEIFSERDFLLQEGYVTDEQKRGASEKLATLIEQGSERNRDILNRLPKMIFPTIEFALRGSSYGAEFAEKWFHDKRVCSAPYFSRYFELQTTEGEISESQFLAFCEASAEADRCHEFVERLKEEGLIPSLVARMARSVKILPTENASVLLPIMFEIAEGLAGVHRGNTFGDPYINAWPATLWYLEHIPVEHRDRLAVDAFQKTKALSVTAMLLNHHDPSNNGSDSSKPLSVDTVMALKADWLEEIRRRSTPVSSLLTAPDLAAKLYNWRRYSCEEEPRRWCREAMVTDHGFANLVDQLMIRGLQSSVANYISTPYVTFDKKTIEAFIGVDTARARCQEIDFGQFPDFAEALRTLATALDGW